jgi:hypothetical protein
MVRLVQLRSRPAVREQVEDTIRCEECRNLLEENDKEGLFIGLCRNCRGPDDQFVDEDKPLSSGHNGEGFLDGEQFVDDYNWDKIFQEAAKKNDLLAARIKELTGKTPMRGLATESRKCRDILFCGRELTYCLSGFADGPGTNHSMTLEQAAALAAKWSREGR